MRHKDFGSAMLAYRNRPEGEPEPVKTNWSVVAANDNNSEDVANKSVERNREIVPSIEAIRRAIGTGDVERNDAGQIVRMGSLQFSDGSQVERAYKLVMGEVTAYAARMPAGAMLGTNEKAKTDAGGSGADQAEVSASDRYFADMFGVKLTPRVSAGRKKRTGRSYRARESRAILAEAYANTDITKVAIHRYPDGLPRAGSRISDSFLGMKKGRSGESGSMAWEDISTSIVNREIWAQSIMLISEQDEAALDAAMTARTLADIAPGGHRRSAERRGKARLMAANDNLMNAIRKATA